MTTPATSTLSDAPLHYVTGAGPQAETIATLNWGLAAQSVVVVAIISLLVLVGALVRRRHGRPADAPGRQEVLHGGGGLKWMYIGLALTTVALIAGITGTMVALADISRPAVEPRFTIEITGRQWWWQVHYDDGTPARMFETANEIHVPVGEPVRIKLTSSDVIHSFWVPALAGKTDLIPGQDNITWIQADKPGVYRGQCAEYCGVQHAHMAMVLVAQPRAEFEAWWTAQLEPAPPPRGEAAQAGLARFKLNCGACHSVRGSGAGGAVGPDLTHLMSRRTLASGMLPNTVGHLSAWIANPQTLKPGAKMPTADISGPDLAAIRRYLLTLD